MRRRCCCCAATARSARWPIVSPATARTLEFPLHYPLVSHTGTLTVGGVTEAVGPGEAWELEEVPAPHRPTYTLVRAIGSAPGVGVAIVFPYTAQFPLLIRVDDAAAVALVGGYIERLIQEPEIFHHDQAVAVANGYLSAGHDAAA